MDIRKIMFVLLFSSLITASSTTKAAFAFCFSPIAPSLYISKPSKPYCAFNRSCSDWEVQSYTQEVERYFRKLKSHLYDVDKYYNDSYDYVKCMSDLD